MPLTTVTLTVTLADQAGAAIEGAVVTALLDRTDLDSTNGFVVPEAVTATSDASGEATLDLWPNALGSQGSRYRISAVDADGASLFVVWASLPNAATDLWDVATLAEPATPFPTQDDTREARLLQDIQDLLRQDSVDAETERKIKRWIKFVTDHMAQRPWWFLRRVAGIALAAGNDVIDIRGAVHRVEAVYAPARLKQVPLGSIVNWRAVAADEGLANAGEATHYAIEGGYRIHLWPAPSEACQFRCVYQRPLDLAILPESLEPTVVHGVLGRYGRHFDRDALSQDPQVFEQRYQMELANAASGTFDLVEMVPSWQANVATASIDAPRSASGSASTFVVPASLSGVGYVSIETGEYPLTVP